MKEQSFELKIATNDLEKLSTFNLIITLPDPKALTDEVAKENISPSFILQDVLYLVPTT